MFVITPFSPHATTVRVVVGTSTITSEKLHHPTTIIINPVKNLHDNYKHRILQCYTFQIHDKNSLHTYHKTTCITGFRFS